MTPAPATNGMLVLVATPIGNLGDMSVRAIDTLQRADVIACEDTRHTRKLLNHHGIGNVSVISLHEHNEVQRAVAVVERVREGQIVAMVTDAGMPAISDPGERVVAAVADAGLKVSVVPGPSALPAALAVSGLPTERFCFEGFLPHKNVDRTTRMTLLAAEERTTVFYEAPHRLAKTVDGLVGVCGGERRVVLVRELTKLHEEIWRGTLAQLSHRLQEANVKGECVLVLEGARHEAQKQSDDAILDALQLELETGSTKRDAAAIVAEQLGVPKKRVYELANRKR